MRRILEQELQAWSQESKPKPLLLRGARQVGKSYLAENLAKSFEQSFVINFERKEHQKFIKLFQEFNPKEILDYIQLNYNINLKAHKSLLFIDEIQICPEAITALRYFYEDLPGLHVIAAGSLLELVLSSSKISVPVGRIDYLYVYPLNFLEFLEATKKKNFITYIQSLSLNGTSQFDIHDELLNELKKYILLGGMPAVINKFIDTKQDYAQAFIEQNSILETYRDDFKKYGSKAEQKYLKLVFDNIPIQLGNKFIFSRVDMDLKSRDLKNALTLLSEANIVRFIYHSSPEAYPLSAGMNSKFFKINFLDCGLANRIFNIAAPELAELKFFGTYSGKITEQFVGQELIACNSPRLRSDLFYWARESTTQAAEIDYLVNLANKNVPIEVKASHNGRLKSLHAIMSDYKIKVGVKISASKLSWDGQILSIPLYAVSEVERLVQEIYGRNQF